MFINPKAIVPLVIVFGVLMFLVLAAALGLLAWGFSLSHGFVLLLGLAGLLLWIKLL